MKHAIEIVCLCVAILPMTGCQMGFDLQVVGAPTAPDFALSPFKGLIGGSQPAVDEVEVVEIGGQHSRTVWAIGRDPKCEPTSRFHYGNTPDQWRVYTKPEPIQSGITYVVSMSGCGFIGGRAFKILRGEIVTAEGFGDLPIKTVEAMK